MNSVLIIHATENDNAKGRKDWIDALRALAMFFVIYGHLLKGWTAYFVFTSPVKICLFFAISGYVFKYNRVSELSFYKNLFLFFASSFCRKVQNVFVGKCNYIL